MEKQNITLVFPYLAEEHLGKDVFLIPFYLGKMNNLSVDILCSPNTNMSKKIRDVNIIQLPFQNKNLLRFYTCKSVLKYFNLNAKKIDVLMEFHINLQVLISMFFYKTINKKGVSYLKADGGDILLSIEKLSPLKKFIYKFLIKKIDIISIETESLYHEIQNKSLAYINKLLYIPNGFDEEQLNEFHIKTKKIDEKENIIITVGRLGALVKNTEFLLEAVKKIDLNGWILMLIGPIESKEQDFQKKIDKFFIENPQLIDKVIFMGPVYNKKELWELYNNAKVFVLTSRSESSGIVLNEANRFSNYILSTNVGCAEDVIKKNNYGTIIKNEKELVQSIQELISGDINLNIKYLQKIDIDMSWNNYLKELSDILNKPLI